MKVVGCLICALLVLLACSKDNPTEPEEKIPTSDSSFFFPLNVGNKWNYYEDDRVDATMSIRVWKSFTLNDTTYMIYGNKELSSDTLHQDEWGRIYKRFNGVNLLWLDFSVADGDSYEYKLSEKLNYTVKVSKNLLIEYGDLSFPGCVQLEFDVPDITTEEEILIFAPDIGPVQIKSPWLTRYLKDWELN